MQVPAHLRGTWTARSVSEDEGKTVLSIVSKAVATFTATAVKNPEGAAHDVVKIVEVRNTDGKMGYLLRLSDGVVMAVTPQKGPDESMLQVMGGAR